MKVLNKSTVLVEPAKQKECPRCRGNGSVSGMGTCWLCKGKGRLWISLSGWTRALNARLENSQLW